MGKIEKLFNETNDLKKFSKGYFDYISELLNQLDVSAVEAFIREIEKTYQSQNTTFFIGNGGSAATASHMANDLSLGLRNCNDLSPFRSLSLTDNVAVMTAAANDTGYDNLFICQLNIHYRPGDKLVAISASGNSPNIIAAAKWVKKRGGMVIGFVGFDGGKLKDICDIVIHVKTSKGKYGPVEDVHSILGHLMYTWLWYKKRKEQEQ